MSFRALRGGVQTGQRVGRKGERRDKGGAGQGVMLTSVCVCACVRVCVHACVCACTRACVCARVHVHTQALVMRCDIHTQALVMHYDVHRHTGSCDVL